MAADGWTDWASTAAIKCSWYGASWDHTFMGEAFDKGMKPDDAAALLSSKQQAGEEAPSPGRFCLYRTRSHERFNVPASRELELTGGAVEVARYYLSLPHISRIDNAWRVGKEGESDDFAITFDDWMIQEEGHSFQLDESGEANE